MDTIKDKVFYSVVGFIDSTKMATFCKDGYIEKDEAQGVAKDLIKQGYEKIMLWREDVWFRNESNEFSASSPIEECTISGCKLLGKSI